MIYIAERSGPLVNLAISLIHHFPLMVCDINALKHFFNRLKILLIKPNTNTLLPEKLKKGGVKSRGKLQVGCIGKVNRLVDMTGIHIVAFYIERTMQCFRRTLKQQELSVPPDIASCGILSENGPVETHALQLLNFYTAFIARDESPESNISKSPRSISIQQSPREHFTVFSGVFAVNCA